MTDHETEARRIFGRRSSHYTVSPCHRDPEVLARVVELSSPQPDWSVLDVATGTGHTAFALAPHIGYLIGIDITPEMLREAGKLRCERSVTNVDLTLAEAHDLPFKDEAFQLVTCRRAAHHFTDIMRALGELSRVLCQGGRFLIDDRSVPEDDFVDECMNTLDRYHDPSHVRQYRPGEWERMLKTLGFSIETIEPYIKHRPLSSLTAGVSNGEVRKIRDVIERLDSAQQRAFSLTEVDGELHFNHWYVMISALKR
jgi:ubiquinone/menaquinone biosynthesis C-methylase UbiE